MTPLPWLDAAALSSLLVALTVLLLLARILGRLARRIGLPAVVGELLTGVILGPSLLGHLAPELAGVLVPTQPDRMHLIDAVAQLGMLLLVGVTGTHVDLAVLRRQSRAVTLVSLFGVAVPMAAGVALGLALPGAGGGSRGPWLFAVFLGVAMSVTALPVIAKTLSDMGLLHRNVGQLTLTAGAISDAIGWLLLSVIAALAVEGTSVGGVGASVLAVVGFVLVAVTLGRVVVRRVMRLAGRAEDNGPVVAAAVLVVLTCAMVAHQLHMEPVFGAFIGGLLLGLPGVVQPGRLEPLRTVVLAVLAPIFLATAGLRVDLTALADLQVALTALLVLAVAIGSKFVGAYLGARLSRMSPWEGLALGAGMNARGVIELIVATIGLRLGVLGVGMYTTIVLVAIVTSLMAPPLLRISMRRVQLNEEERLRELEHRSWQTGGNPVPPPVDR
ncbi:cation:proton antiporter [Solwaraspora sp. WMMA2056]|uniref:cation:proton antiporter n=1 Tax=Solwaraspora sp. WMMA2056 TaxID=3015161 RepID=UPI00259B21E7|nr:cation:proton antiporter [Solwaraspora sp. WMMA2056]WJK42575.1 cation:proton antiporter [Solwaraspora sp. WMMA2056]